MSEAKHTPGPWLVDESGKTVSSNAVTDIAIINMANTRYGWGGSDFCGISYREANARLIASAPELLEACVEMLAEMMVWEDHQGTHPAAIKARAAIAKATGETK